MIDEDPQSTAHEKEVADGVLRQFKSPEEIRGYSKANHRQTRKHRQQVVTLFSLSTYIFE